MSDDDEQEVQEVIVSVMDDNLYFDVQFEQIFVLLILVIDLFIYLVMLKFFILKVFIELVDQVCIIMQSENKVFWKVKFLLIKLVGDNIWVLCGFMSGFSDVFFFIDFIRFFKCFDWQCFCLVVFFVVVFMNGVILVYEGIFVELVVCERIEGVFLGLSVLVLEDIVDGEILLDVLVVINGEINIEVLKLVECLKEFLLVNGDSKLDERLVEEVYLGDMIKDEEDDEDVVMVEV